jgi:hypothetical protein
MKLGYSTTTTATKESKALQIPDFCKSCLKKGDKIA